MTMADISFTETGETKQTAEYSLKTPPQSIEAEQSVLGGLMLENQRWDDVAEIVSEQDFSSRPHRSIFSAMRSLVADRQGTCRNQGNDKSCQRNNRGRLQPGR